MIGAPSRRDTPANLDAEGHICLVVDDDRTYGELATRFVADGNARNQKTFAFGPQGSPLQERLRPLASVAVDPYVEFLARGPLQPEIMFQTFREQARIAARDGYSGLCVAADMDWLLPASRGSDEALQFEVLLDRVAQDLDATILCAYRRQSFEDSLIHGMLCTHPVTAGHVEAPPFKLVAGEQGWALAGEVDLASAPVLATALKATAESPWVIDASGLAFADLAAMRAIVGTVLEVGLTLELRGARPAFRHHWELAGFAAPAFDVRFSEAQGMP